MRAGSLSDPFVAELLEKDFVCAWEKKGAVESYRVKGMPDQDFKRGGNILTYVCTPWGDVIHAIPGRSSSVEYRQSLEWARDLYRRGTGFSREERVGQVRSAHRLQRPMEAHELLSREACRPLREVEKEFFETLLGEVYAPEKDILIREISSSDYASMRATWRSG